MATDLSDGELRDIVESVTWENFDGHAYSPNDLKQIRAILRLSEDKFPDKLLHRYTDELVALIGLALFVARKEKGKENILKLERKLLRPAQNFLTALENPDIQLEYLQPWTPMKSELKDELAENVRDFIAKLNDHINQVKYSSKKGKAWDSELKMQFLKYVDILCEYLNHDFEPTRNVAGGQEEASQFRDMALLMVRPLQWGDHTGNKIYLDGALRNYVDSWNAAKIRMAQMLQDKHG